MDTEPTAIAERWFRSFSEAIHSQDADAVSSSLFADGYWRDLLTLSWDIRTLHFAPIIKTFLETDGHLKSSGLCELKLEGVPTLVEAMPGFTWIQCLFTFETNIARGRGFFRLMQDSNDSSWKAKALYTGIEELKEHEEKQRKARPVSVNYVPHTDQIGGKLDIIDKEPVVLIVGAGQCGLSLGARLKQLKISTILIDKNDRVGDNWRKRYKSLVLHDPVWFDHLPYVPFPDHWPIFSPKDKLADWFEAYAIIMNLNIWMRSSIKSAVYDEVSHTWTVAISRAGHPDQVIKPKFVVLATGASGEPNIPVFKDQSLFKGPVCHSSQYKSGERFKDKKAIVVGCCNSGHDIAQDLHEHGADVTIVQRSSTYVISSTGVGCLLGALYGEEGPPTEDADIMNFSLPVLMYSDLHKYATEQMSELDRDILEGLRKVGFKLNTGINGAGLMMTYFIKGGGYYIDVGASKLIAEKKIKIKQGHEISYFTENSLVFDDDTEIEADIVVLATGYQNMRTTAIRILGPEAERISEVWGLDSEGELNGIARTTGHPGIYTLGGNLAHARFWSKRLALRIKAQVEGLVPW
ncbi:pyridine nucleotide-disulfide oxidoreductase family protein [Guyanagaster necrorhizus]|uniref:Pyridine nucleotide-disulfide oxidoreductase family protein n=1 Tax=Guyanagaster necrorhizus TaxID=856835 RepID=A0A9P7VWV6_9AGAR|nr:pyridine nucleotide-disulfide oxidoreductase family protein [Guyanagaster necrorhizus MCA 3950]KAG7448195.1 pyridine nucleotide-disulfide oxidoreductase family protein [Guyanagaster necrorhizus MCA 3950]